MSVAEMVGQEGVGEGRRVVVWVRVGVCGEGAMKWVRVVWTVVVRVERRVVVIGWRGVLVQ